MICQRLVFIFFAAMFCTVSLQVSAAREIRITTGHWPPYLDERAPGNGFVANIISEAYASQGIDVEFSFFPWSRALIMVRSEHYDASAVWSCTRERLKDYIYSAPILPYQYVFYHRAEEAFQWETLSDLKGMTIGLTQGYSYGETLGEAIDRGWVTADTTTSDAANFQKLLLDRIDLFPMDPVVGSAILNEHFPLNGSRITFHPRPLRKAFHHIVFDRSAPAAEELRLAFDRGITELRESGRYQTLITEALASIRSPVAAGILEDQLVNWESPDPCFEP